MKAKLFVIVLLIVGSVVFTFAQRWKFTTGLNYKGQVGIITGFKVILIEIDPVALKVYAGAQQVWYEEDGTGKEISNQPLTGERIEITSQFAGRIASQTSPLSMIKIVRAAYESVQIVKGSTWIGAFSTN